MIASTALVIDAVELVTGGVKDAGRSMKLSIEVTEDAGDPGEVAPARVETFVDAVGLAGACVTKITGAMQTATTSV